MTDLVRSIRSEFERYKALADRTLEQLSESQLSDAPPGGLSVASICWHISGNLQSRFTEFLSSDGEKPWRQREEEFERRAVTRDELQVTWEKGWRLLFETLATLGDEQLGLDVHIRGQALKVHEALHRALAHVSYHVGQIVYIGKAWKGTAWHYLSIPPGGTAAYNQNPTRERTPGDETTQ